MSVTWEPGLGDHLRNIWRYKWFILGGAIVVAEVVFVLLSAVTPRYEAEASIRLTIRSDGALLLDEDQVEYASRVYAELAESQRITDAAVEAADVSIGSAEAASSFDVDWARPPGFVDVTASATTAEGAVKLADGMAEALIQAIDADTERVIGQATAAGDNATPRSTLTAELVEPASEPGSPAAPRPLRDAIAAFVVSLVVLAELAALWRPARGLLPLSRTAERVTELVGIPALTLTGDPEDRTRLALFAARHLTTKPAVLMVHCDGESLPAAPVRLAEAVTAGGRRSLVVDGEGPEPNMHRRLGLPQGPGLAEVVTGQHDLPDTVFESQAKSKVSLLTAGGKDGAKTEIAANDPLERLGAGYDFVIINVGSAALLDGVAAAVAEQRRSTILVIDPEKAKRRKLSEVVHGFGGHEDVIAILLLTRSAAAAETTRLAARWWSRKQANGSPKSEASGSKRNGLKASGSRTRRTRQRS